jgi:hypothetical protein
MALSRSSSVEAVGEIVAALTDRLVPVRWLASASLAWPAGPTVILALRSLAVSDLAVEPGPRPEAVKVLGRVGDGAKESHHIAVCGRCCYNIIVIAGDELSELHMV